ncbi:hypothetical protein GUA87_00145 [Sneathiella sp. P13V-1]|uniref:thermonuclease family protein n=1 Tax=Sneathiella sp. P13V-1 TaxID=2697366 RepID=UPI00187B1B3F|nr:hypothetical protein [Sneathiella sp. P13V-1]MBE7635238.1 hypothetical protein [Sneathiella sp. P13V-1]
MLAILSNDLSAMNGQLKNKVLPLLIGLAIVYFLSPMFSRFGRLEAEPKYTLSGTLVRKGVNSFVVEGQRIAILGVKFPYADQSCTEDEEGLQDLNKQPVFSCLQRANQLSSDYLSATSARCEILFEVGQEKVGIANCFSGDTNIGSELILKGYAYAERSFTGGMYLPEEYWSRIKLRGLWQNYTIHPEDFRERKEELIKRIKEHRGKFPDPLETMKMIEELQRQGVLEKPSKQ